MIESFPGVNKKRRIVTTAFATLAVGMSTVACHADREQPAPSTAECQPVTIPTNVEVVRLSKTDILCSLGSLAIKGRAPMTGYDRDKSFGGWKTVNKCDTRDRILKRDLEHTTVDKDCEVQSGVLHDPYTGTEIVFVRGRGTSSKIQIDHVVALGDAWQKGAQQMEPERRAKFANDGLNLLAVSGRQNDQKQDGDIATWVPENNKAWCDYAARQTLVKDRYDLSVTQAEHDKLGGILTGCQQQEFSLAQ